MGTANQVKLAGVLEPLLCGLAQTTKVLITSRFDNTFDKQNRFKEQKVSTGAFSSAQYVTDDKGNMKQVNVDGPEGLSRYFFNEFG